MAVRNLPPNQKGTVAPATSPPRADAAGVGGRGPRSYGVQKAPVDPVAADVESGMDISDDEVSARGIPTRRYTHAPSFML